MESIEEGDGTKEQAKYPMSTDIIETVGTDGGDDKLAIVDDKTNTNLLDDEEKTVDNVTYNDEGVAIFTDPATKFKYKWCTETKAWKLLEDNILENEHYRWCTETQKWVLKDNVVENEYYRWCDKTNQWIPKMTTGSSTDGITYGYDEKINRHIYTDKDGAIFFWDAEKKGWFPKVDDDFLAIYQLNYGFVDNISSKKSDSTENKQPELMPSTSIPILPGSIEDASTQPETSTDASACRKRKAPPPTPKWFDLPAEQNTKVYVSNLPLDITEEEFSELMSKCGMIMKDNKTNKFKLKLYRDINGQLKGDGLCHYIKIESIELALNVLDGYDVRGKKINVQRAEFQMRGAYNPALKPRVKKQDKEKMKKVQEKLFDWRPEKMRGERAKHERTIIIKNLFEPELFDREVHLLLDYQNDLRDECSKCGTVRKVTVYDRHPEGIAQITMSDAEEADLVVQLMNGRFFGQRKLTAETWDGKTKFKMEESESDMNKRLDKWEKYLEDEENKKELLEEQTYARTLETNSKVQQNEEEKEKEENIDKQCLNVEKESEEKESQENVEPVS